MLLIDVTEVAHETQANCNQSLKNNSPCAFCTTTFSTLPSLGQSLANLSDCIRYPSIHAVAFSNQFGPSGPGTTKCLLSLDFPFEAFSSQNKKFVIVVVAATISILALSLLILEFWAYCN
ncbi:hypothetical protein VNO77_11588 [Canavalia gladiata]|uniref:Uncharacterized protein n=1 Tax=Canavalia gladiata TaxID=3824 RepID=A0AAN9MD20_CANGL